ncbi:MAG TPA: hypothetical protein VHO47_03230 [Candidatus Babeliales bacterium]|nr:hypothetical protein [Candidatus Babeliales bacterium]
MAKTPKSVTWADDFDKQLASVRKYTPDPKEISFDKEFTSFYEIARALARSKSEADEHDRLLNVFGLEKNGSISNIQCRKNTWHCDVRINGCFIDDIYTCSVAPSSDDDNKPFHLQVKKCASVPNTVAFCSLVVGIIGGAMVTLGNLK